jgi:hypothetical protein
MTHLFDRSSAATKLRAQSVGQSEIHLLTLEKWLYRPNGELRQFGFSIAMQFLMI